MTCVRADDAFDIGGRMASSYEPLDIDAYVNDVRDHNRFPVVDDLNSQIYSLAAGHPQSARLGTVGTSRRGEPLRLLTIGSGSRNILMVGGPHPNEPVGFLTVLETARLVAAAPELTHGSDYTWHFLPCIDPDGARLNEAWYAAPLTISTYHRHFYRPAFADQPEWTFPLQQGSMSRPEPLPETRALMRVIDTLRPHVQFSLHNADFGGAYFILSHAYPDLATPLAAAAARHDIPLETHPTDAHGWHALGEGVYVMPPAEAAIPPAENGEPRRHGASSSHYANRHHTLTMITEVPLWRTHDMAPPSTSYGELLSNAADDLHSATHPLAASLARVSSDLTLATPFQPAVVDALRNARSIVAMWREQADAVASARPATPGEQAGARNTTRHFSLRTLGMLLRLLQAERAASNRTPVIRAELAALEARFGDSCERVRRDTQATPVRDLVAVQVRAALTTAAWRRKR
jgi:hypothetical protein